MAPSAARMRAAFSFFSSFPSSSANDVFPHEFADEERLPLHRLALVSLGTGIFDNLDFERLAEVARRLGRYEFLFTAAPLRIEMGMGSPINPIATF